MARPLRLQFPGAVYHLMSRGNGGGNIFEDQYDYASFLELFKDVLEDHIWICYAYCLMPNHYHLLVKTVDPNLSIGMRQLNGKYTQKFNIRHKRFGHVFQGRYKAILVDMETYRYELIRYIVLNPVRAGIVKGPSEWRWSSHLEMAGDASNALDSCLDLERALLLFGNGKKEAREAYMEYILSRMDDEDLEMKASGGLILGGDEFVGKIKETFEGYEGIKEISVRERYAHRPSLELLFGNGHSVKSERNGSILKAVKEYGYSFSEIGRFLNLHYSSIGKIVKKGKLKEKS